MQEKSATRPEGKTPQQKWLFAVRFLLKTGLLAPKGSKKRLLHKKTDEVQLECKNRLHLLCVVA